MSTETVVGVCGAVGAVAVLIVLVCWRGKAWVRWVVLAALYLCLNVAVQFLLMPLVPKLVLAAVLFGGIIVGIFVAAVVGARKARRDDASRSSDERG